MSLAFTDGATFSDGAGFTLWRPHLFTILVRRPMLAFHDPAGNYHQERSFSCFGGAPARRYALLELAGSGGSHFDVWLAADHQGGITGHLDASPWCGPMLPVAWSPIGGLAAPAALGWATKTFGPDNARRFRLALAELCACAWLELTRP